MPSQPYSLPAAMLIPVAEASDSCVRRAPDTVAVPDPIPLRRRFYCPQLDVVRCLAFMMVFACHGFPYDGRTHFEGNAWKAVEVVRQAGNFSLCLFFLLSAYLITELLQREYYRTHRIQLAAFYMRRILRIWPLYFSTMLICTAVGLFFHQLQMPIAQLATNLLFLGNWYMLGIPGQAVLLSWLWSISVEEQFYILWPSILRLGGIRSVAIGSILCFPMAHAAIWWITQDATRLDVRVWLNSFVQFLFFAAGALLAFALRGRSVVFSQAQRIAMLVGWAATWLIASGYCQIKAPNTTAGAWKMCLGYDLVAVGCVLFLFVALGDSKQNPPRFLVYLGKISFGMYIFHGIAIGITTNLRHVLETHGLETHGVALIVSFALDRVLALGLTIGVAALSYEFFEKRFLEWKKRFTVVESRPV